jgi:hypothetical protein
VRAGRRNVALALAGFGALIALVKLARAIPSLTAHPHTPATVKWSLDGRLPPLNPDLTAHQHRSARGFHSAGSTAPPYSARGVWDDRTYRQTPLAPFNLGHGFIEESDAARVPTFCFTGAWPAHDLHGEDPASLVRLAFTHWSSITSLDPALETGIEFREVPTAPLPDGGAAGCAADIVVFWDAQAGAFGGGFFNHATRELHFDNSMSWFFQQRPRQGHPTGIRAGQWHFFSVALHEVGHSVGLVHQAHATCVMTPSVGQPPDVGGHRYFERIDLDSADGVRDLYSIPRALPAGGGVVAVPDGGGVDIPDGGGADIADGGGGGGKGPNCGSCSCSSAPVIALVAALVLRRRRPAHSGC